MKPVEDYRNREQTYLKHFILERYLERVAFVIGNSHPEFVYVDGFSGPWESQDEKFEDTSFIIAIKKLRYVRDSLVDRVGKEPMIRCLFIERDETAFEALEDATRNVKDLEIKALRGKFEELVPDILRFVGRSFSLVFIDPTGWTGFGMRAIEPILRHDPGEVLINFMYDPINRFLTHRSREVETSIDQLFGDAGWRDALRSSGDREDSIVDTYRERLRSAGRFRHATSTRILKPISDRSYFHLVYGTRHIRGLLEFRKVEEKFADEQERVRSEAKQRHRVKHTGQPELLFGSTGSTDVSSSQSFREERGALVRTAGADLRKMLRQRRRISYDDALGALLERPLVWESDVKELIDGMRCNGELTVEGLNPGERTVKWGRDHTLVFMASPPR